MSNLWTFILVSSQAVLILLAKLYLEDAVIMWAVFIIMLIAAFKTLSNNNAARKAFNRQFKLLHHRTLSIGKKQQEHHHQQDLHENSPHIVATAIIMINGCVTIEESTGIIASITDLGIGNLDINVDNPEGHSLIPNVETDSLEKVAVKTKSHSVINLSWDKGEPSRIYFTLTRNFALKSNDD